MHSEPSTSSVPAVSWEILEKSLTHPNVLIRTKAIEAAGRFPDARAVAALQALVRDDNPAIRSSAALALVETARQQHAVTESALAQLITSAADDELRLFLIANVAGDGGDILLRAVIASLVDPAGKIRQAAERALEQRGGAWMIGEVAGEMLPTIEGARSAFNAEVSAAATKWATQLQRAQLRRTMLNSGLATALTLSRALQSSNPILRAAAAEALWRTSDTRAVPALREALRDHDEDVRHAAALSLGNLRWQPASLDELIAWEVAMQRWDYVVARGESALEPLLFAAAHSSPAMQARAVESVAQLNSLLAMLQLVPLLDSPHPVVSHATAKALKALDWVPINDSQAIQQAVQLEDWARAVSFGTAAVAPLAMALKESHARPVRRAAILTAMHSLTDPNSVFDLLQLCRDGEVAAAAVSALERVLQRSADRMGNHVLESIQNLKNVVSFKFTIDSRIDRAIRSGMELVDLTGVRQQAADELARRTEGDQLDELAMAKEGTP